MTHRSVICFALAAGMMPAAFAQTPAANNASAEIGNATSSQAAPAKTYTVPAGTKILLSLRNEISTRSARPGDAVYLVSDFPVVEDGAVVLPAGMYVKGTIDMVQRPGKVKGRAQLQMHFVSMIFPNGAEIAIPGSLANAHDANGASVKDAEGTVEQAGSQGRDAQRIADYTLTGTGVGALAGWGAGSPGLGTGIGAGAGAAAGILTTLLTRGNDIVFQPGTTLEMELTRSLTVKEGQLTGMAAYTGLNDSKQQVPVAAQQAATPLPAPKN